ncbi:MAG: hypothetical protein OXF56_26945 [Rhodobacteraceae bacterium]|nr:hypothetical protein [Paracoccaceae bacterium]
MAPSIATGMPGAGKSEIGIGRCDAFGQPVHHLQIGARIELAIGQRKFDVVLGVFREAKPDLAVLPAPGFGLAVGQVVSFPTGWHEVGGRVIFHKEVLRLTPAAAERHGAEPELIHTVDPSRRARVEQALAKSEPVVRNDVPVMPVAVVQGNLFVEPILVGEQNETVFEHDIGWPVAAEIETPDQLQHRGSRCVVFVDAPFDQPCPGRGGRSAVEPGPAFRGRSQIDLVAVVFVGYFMARPDMDEAPGIDVRPEVRFQLPDPVLEGQDIKTSFRSRQFC